MNITPNKTKIVAFNKNSPRGGEGSIEITSIKNGDSFVLDTARVGKTRVEFTVSGDHLTEEILPAMVKFKINGVVIRSELWTIDKAPASGGTSGGSGLTVIKDAAPIDMMWSFDAPMSGTETYLTPLDPGVGHPFFEVGEVTVWGNETVPALVPTKPGLFWIDCEFMIAGYEVPDMSQLDFSFAVQSVGVRDYANPRPIEFSRHNNNEWVGDNSNMYSAKMPSRVVALSPETPLLMWLYFADYQQPNDIAGGNWYATIVARLTALAS